MDGWVARQIQTDMYYLLSYYVIYNYFLNMMVIVTATGLFRCLLNMKKRLFPPQICLKVHI